MENNLLDAMQDDTMLGGIKNFERVVNQSSHEYLKNCILDLLRLQREKSLSEAKKEMDKLCPEILSIEQLILNAKLIETQNKQ